MSINIWMQLLGFDRDDPDRGAARFLDRTGFVPDNVCALLFHSDFVHLHRGMDEEYTLLPDNCAYYAVPRNLERERQPWTNHDLRELVAQLKKRGVGFYAGLMGSYLNNMFHSEWLSAHPELRLAGREHDGGLHCLKRFKDGTYYEDFFAEKLRAVLADYDMAGVHLADGFCPSTMQYRGDYSTDMTAQFLDRTGLRLPAAVSATMGDDSVEARQVRADYLWGSLREEWLRFYEWRWARFFEKITAPVHAQGRQVWVLGMYCTDPFETRMLYAFDTKKVMDAGVDCITANTLPTSVALNAPGREYYFHRYHMDTPFLRAQIGDRRFVNMVGVQDATEEWSVLDHRPVLLERDIYTESSFRAVTPDGCRRASDGFFLCLGDGLPRQSWDFMKRRMDIGLGTDAARAWSPVILWSDAAEDRQITEYIRTRRTSSHKQSFEIWKAGTPFGGCVRSDALAGFTGTLFVPNFDLLPPDERKAVLDTGAAIVGTVPKGFDYAPNGVKPSFTFADGFSDWPLEAFVTGFEPDQAIRDEIAALCAADDGKPQLPASPDDNVYPLTAEVPFRKLTDGFIRACGAVLTAAMQREFPVKSSKPMLALRLKDGADRLWLYNTDDDHYGHAVVESADPLDDVQVVSAYPIQPVRFLQESNTSFAYNYAAQTKQNKFQTKLAPGGVTIVDIRRA